MQDSAAWPCCIRTFESKSIASSEIQSDYFISVRDVAQPGRALGLGPRRRRFKSCRPDHSSFVDNPPRFVVTPLTICNPVRHLPGHREAGTAPWGYRQPCQVLKPEGFHGRIGFPNLFRPNQRSPSRKDPQRSVTDKQRRQRALPCHRAVQNQPLAGDSKPASLKWGFHNSYGGWIKGFACRINEPGTAASPSSRPRRSTVPSTWRFSPLGGMPTASL